MELLNQFDVQNPDHVSVITKEGKLTVSILKDGSSVTLGFPVKSAWLDTTPRPPLQQSAPREEAVKSQATNLVIKKKVRISPAGNPKLSLEDARSIKEMLADTTLVSAFRSKQQAYEAIGRKFGVSHHTISNIHKGIAWRHA